MDGRTNDAGNGNVYGKVSGEGCGNGWKKLGPCQAPLSTLDCQLSTPF